MGPNKSAKMTTIGLYINNACNSYISFMKKILFIIFSILVVLVLLLFYGRTGGFPGARGRETSVLKSAAASFTVTFLDVGQGDAAFLESTEGAQMLVDCGRDGSILPALGRVMDFFDKEIDYLLVTHPDLDHYGGCTDVLKRFDVKNIVYTGVDKPDSQWKYFWATVEAEGAEFLRIDARKSLSLGEGKLDFLFPDTAITRQENTNNTSIVFKFSFGEMDALFVGDAEAEVETHLVEKYGDYLDTEILKVGHHGSGSSSGSEFLRVVTPEISIISVGADNHYGHPSGRVIKRLERMGSRIFRTDLAGDIKLRVYRDRVEKF